jgi:uncharacterized protein (TIGR00299 family) protein
VKIGYFDCFAGASGDMIMACLFDLGLERSVLADCIAGLGIGEVEFEIAEVMRKQIRARSFSVRPPVDPEPRNYRDIVGIVEAADMSAGVKRKSIETFGTLAEAEGGIHGMPRDEVHFHEVGAVDSIVDVVGAFVGLEALGIEQVVSSPLTLGSGILECAHGPLPVPAPATLRIAEGLPVKGLDAGEELTTPTGAAILRTAAARFGPIPSMTVKGVGYGAGTRDLDRIPNIMRLVVGETSGYGFDEVVVLETNMDDMNPQFFSHIYQDLFAGGALDVWVTDVLMKKGRPGFVLSVLADQADMQRMADLIFSGTTTSGIRVTTAGRLKLDRESVDVQTRYGKVSVKVFTLSSGRRCVPEYEDCLRVSRAEGVSIDRVIEEARHVCERMRKETD